MKTFLKKLVRNFMLNGIVLSIGLLGASTALAGPLAGTVPTSPGSTVFPGLVAPGTDPGSLLDWMIAPFSTSGGINTGTIASAVYDDGGTLDFYYQVTNSSNSATALTRETNTSFLDFTTATGFRIDGSSLMGGNGNGRNGKGNGNGKNGNGRTGTFVDGTVAPVTADSNVDGSVIGFSFNLPGSPEIAPGEESYILVISTDATRYSVGSASIISSDGGMAIVQAFQAVPEPASMALLGLGLVALAGVRRWLCS